MAAMHLLPTVARPALLGLLLLAVGCSTLDVPRADNYPASGQKKVRAVHHWDVLAGDVAARIADKISEWPAGEHLLYLSAPPAGSFNQGFRKLLMAHLLERGVALSTEPTAVQLHIETQVVQHEAAAHNSAGLPYTRLAAGVAVARDIAVHAQSAPSGIAAGLALGMALDAATLYTDGAAAGGPTRTEVLVTTSLESGGRYLASTADMYYIERAEAGLYRNAPPQAPLPALTTWQVVKP